MDLKLARRYARALFVSALEQQAAERVAKDLDETANTVNGSEELRRVMYNPLVADERKTEIVQQLFRESVHPLTMRLLEVMIQKDRELLFEEVRDEYNRLLEDHLGMAKAVVYSALPLEQGDRQRIVESLEKAMGKKIEADFETEPSLIGGVRAVIGDYEVDGSIRRYLDEMRDSARLEIERRRAV